MLILFAASATGQIAFPTFASTTGLTFVGAASQVGTVIRLTSGPSEAGAAWYGTKQLVSKGFITRFSFRISDTLGQSDAEGRIGGDGFAFVIQNAASRSIGGIGGLLGYDGIP